MDNVGEESGTRETAAEAFSNGYGLGCVGGEKREESFVDFGEWGRNLEGQGEEFSESFNLAIREESCDLPV